MNRYGIWVVIGVLFMDSLIQSHRISKLEENVSVLLRAHSISTEKIDDLEHVVYWKGPVPEWASRKNMIFLQPTPNVPYTPEYEIHPTSDGWKPNPYGDGKMRITNVPAIEWFNPNKLEINSSSGSGGDIMRWDSNGLLVYPKNIGGLVYSHLSPIKVYYAG